MGDGIQARIARPFVFVIAGIAVVGVVLLMALLYEATTIECTRTRGAEGACVVTQRRVVGRSERRVASSAIRGTSMSVSTSHRAGASAGHTDTIFVMDLTDGSSIVVDDLAFGFLDPSFDKSDAQAIDRFIADKTIEHTRATNGGVASLLATTAALAALAAALVWLWGFASIAIALDGKTLVVTGEEVSRHAIEDVSNVDVDKTYHSLRVHYRDGTSRQTARLGVPIARLEDLARQTRALLNLTT